MFPVWRSYRYFRLSAAVAITCRQFLRALYLQICRWNFSAVSQTFRDITISGFGSHFRLSIIIGILMLSVVLWKIKMFPVFSQGGSSHGSDMKRKVRACAGYAIGICHIVSSVCIASSVRPVSGQRCPFRGQYLGQPDDTGCQLSIRSSCKQTDHIDVVSTCLKKPSTYHHSLPAYAVITFAITIRLWSNYDPTTTCRAPASNSTQANNEHVNFSA